MKTKYYGGEIEVTGPFRVVYVDAFEAGRMDGEGYYDEAEYEDGNEAIKAAKEITEKNSGEPIPDYAIVYDSQGKLVWRPDNYPIT